MHGTLKHTSASFLYHKSQVYMGHTVHECLYNNSICVRFKHSSQIFYTLSLIMCFLRGGSEEKVSSRIDGTNASFRPMILVVLMGLIYKTYKETNKNI